MRCPPPILTSCISSELWVPEEWKYTYFRLKQTNTGTQMGLKVSCTACQRLTPSVGTIIFVNPWKCVIFNGGMYLYQLKLHIISCVCWFVGCCISSLNSISPHCAQPPVCYLTGHTEDTNWMQVQSKHNIIILYWIAFRPNLGRVCMYKNISKNLWGIFRIKIFSSPK